MRTRSLSALLLVLLCLTLLNEDGETGSADCAPVCKEICERLVGYAADS